MADLSRDPVIVPLQFITRIGGQDAERLTIQRPRARDFWEMDAVSGEQRKLDALLATCCGATLQEIGDLDVVDRMAAQEALLPFLTSPARPTASA